MSREVRFRCWKDGKMADDAESKFWLSQGFDYDFMQYTGLKDKNGKEIYEGDIVQSDFDPHSIAEVRWVYSFNRSGFEFIGDLRGPLPSLERLQVIGNIYENPDLLEAT